MAVLAFSGTYSGATKTWTWSLASQSGTIQEVGTWNDLIACLDKNAELCENDSVEEGYQCI